MAKKKIVRATKVAKNDYFENNAIGLALGILLSGMHAAWLILVYIGLAKPLMDWVLGLHMIQIPFSMMEFNSGRALGLLILTFLVGYVVGWILAALLKMAREKK